MLQMLLVNPFNIEDINGAVYDFEKAGDILPKHNHDENNIHITIVCRGKLKAYSHDWEIEAEAGKLFDFRAGEPHELMALEDNTRIVNIVKKHNGYIDDNMQEILENPLKNTSVEIV